MQTAVVVVVVVVERWIDVLPTPSQQHHRGGRHGVGVDKVDGGGQCVQRATHRRQVCQSINQASSRLFA